MMMRRHRSRALLLAIALAVTACGDGDGDSIDSSPTVSASTGADDSTDTSDPGSTVPSSTETTSDSNGTTSTTSSGSDDLPGEPWEGFADDGDVLSVIGVAADDVLNVRAVPGTDADIVATVEPTGTGLVATGRARQLTESLWYEVTVDGTTGWVSLAFVAYEGATDDATADFLDGGTLPEVETMEELGELVAAAFASVDPPSDIVPVVAPTVGDLAEVTYDVVGLGDDAVFGLRLHIFATPLENEDGFVLSSIERTIFCGRGLSGELCV